MASGVNPDFPTQTTATTGSVRANFAAMKDEIEVLQTSLAGIPIVGSPQDSHALVFRGGELHWEPVTTE